MPYPRDNKTGGNSSKRYGKRSFGGDFGGAKPTMHPAVCSECNQDCEVPFKPSGDRPVLCRNCFKGKGGDTGPHLKKSFQKPPYGGKRESSGGMTKEQFEILDAKLNKIIDMLESAE